MPGPAQDEPDDVADLDEAPLAEHAVVRRAPRYRAFVGVGALAALVVAVAGVLALDVGRSRTGTGVVVVLAAVAAVVVGGLIAASVAVLLDRSARRP